MRAKYARGADRRPAQNDSLRGWDTREVRRRAAAHSGPARARWRCANGYPSIAGIGPRTAAELLNRYRQIEIFLHTFSANSAISHCFSKNSQPCAPMRRSVRRSRRSAGAVRRRHSRPGRVEWKRHGCSSVAKRLRDNDALLVPGPNSTRYAVPNDYSSSSI
jgi:hypothetical protein